MLGVCTLSCETVRPVLPEVESFLFTLISQTPGQPLHEVVEVRLPQGSPEGAVFVLLERVKVKS